MKSINWFCFAMLFLTFGAASFTPNNSELQRNKVFTCYIYRTDLTAAKWNEIADQHGFTEYIIIDEGTLGTPGHVISAGSYYGDWEGLMNCLGLPASIASIIIADDLGGA